jgi:hypothetical protein
MSVVNPLHPELRRWFSGVLSSLPMEEYANGDWQSDHLLVQTHPPNDRGHITYNIEKLDTGCQALSAYGAALHASGLADFGDVWHDLRSR